MIINFLVILIVTGFASLYAAENAVALQDMKPGVVYVVEQPNAKTVTVETGPQEAIQQPSEVESFEPCQCYCSDLCDYRARKADDTPEMDPETGKLFCKPRDKYNYPLNKCNTKPEPVLKPELGPLCPEAQ